jgi:putative serine protease PepD
MDETQQFPRNAGQGTADPHSTLTMPAIGDHGPTPPGPAGGEPHRTAAPARRGVGLLVAVALAAGLIGGGAGAAVTYGLTDRGTATSFDTAPAGGTDGDARSSVLGSVEQVAGTVLPSVVSIAVRSGGNGPFGAAASAGSGSGVVISADGLVLTNNHVVAAAADGGRLTVTFNDGRTATATIVGRDPASDIAVIKAAGVSGLTPVTIGRSGDLKVGEQVVAVGSPLGLSGTVTTGIVSALNRPVRTGGSETPGEDRSTVLDAIQTDAPINPGNSGGPLVNMRGELVGINTAIASLGAGLGGQSGSIGLGFAIPIDQARPIAEQLSKQGVATHARLGVGVQDAVGTDQGAAGALLASIEQGSPAAQAGLQQGDIVTKLDDRRIDSADALVAAVRSHRPDDEVTVTYRRGGETKTAKVRLVADRPAA